MKQARIELEDVGSILSAFKLLYDNYASEPWLESLSNMSNAVARTLTGVSCVGASCGALAACWSQKRGNCVLARPSPSDRNGTSVVVCCGPVTALFYWTQRPKKHPTMAVVTKR